MTNYQVVLASASPARLKTLQNAGVYPEVIVSDVDERGLVAAVESESGLLSPAEQPLLLARAKAEAVATVVAGRSGGAIVIGCDSVFEFQGQPYGRPPNAAVAVERIKAMSGNSGVLHTGHWIILLPDKLSSTRNDRLDPYPFNDPNPVSDGAAGDSLAFQEVGAVGSSIVHFGNIDDAEIAAYVATGEPLDVAGSFTVDGLGGPFIESIAGDYHNVVGISLPLVRRLLNQLGINWRDIRA